MARAFLTHPITDDSALGGSVIERSLRFNSGDNAYLSRTPSSASNRRTFTWSGWIKRSKLDASNNAHVFFDSRDGASQSIECTFGFLTNNTFYFDVTGAGIRTNALFRDVAAWQHWVIAVDTTQATSSNRVKIYVNGVQQTSFSSANYPSQNYETAINAQHLHSIGRYNNGGHHDGYMAEINFIDGQQLTPSSFGYTDFQTGIWRPKRYEGTYGTNGFYLNFLDNSSTSTLGKDTSGNGNDFTPNNFATTDAVKDSPTNNFCTLNINDNNLSESSPHFVYSEGNLKAAWSFTGTNFDRAYGTLFVEGSDTNKYYWEATGTQNNEQMRWGVHGTHTSSYRANNRNTNGGAETDVAVMMWQPYASAPYLMKIDANDAGVALSTSNGNAANGDIFSFVFDGATGKFYVWFKGVEVSGQDYAAGTSVFDAVDSTKTYALLNGQGDGGGSTKNGNFILNWGQDSSFAGTKTAQGNTDANGIGDFYYSVPSGAKALCSENLPPNVPSIVRPQKHFDVLTYTGDQTNGTRSITGLEFTPNFVWLKCRSSATSHNLYDSVRGFGANKEMCTDKTQAEGGENGAQYGYVTQNSSGFNLVKGSDGTLSSAVYNININNATYVAWCWKAGGAAVANSDGTINTQVSVNEEAGFSIVTYTGNGSTTATIGHGLGKTPACIILKNRSSSADWVVMHEGIGSYDGGNYKHQPIKLKNEAKTSILGIWQTPNSSTQQISDGQTSGGNRPLTNTSGNNYVAYFWAEIPGFSKFGSYVGNGLANGPFVFTGFRPAFILFKNENTATNWELYDATRPYGEYNPAFRPLYANHSYVEETHASLPALDILSNGFKPRSTWDEFNKSGSPILYMAFAEQPGSTAYATETNAR